jgi:cell wall-associated NlpC family hydrolase
VGASAAMVLLAGANAHAAPSAAELERQIDVAWNKLEPIIEQHNGTRLELARQRARSQALGQQIQPLQMQVDLAMSRVGEIAVQIYKGGRTSAMNALLTSGSPTTLADQLTFLDQVARDQQSQISNVAELKAQYEQQKAPLDEAVARLATTEADLAAKEKVINTELKRLEGLRVQLYGSSGGPAAAPRPANCPTADPGGKAGIAVKFACAQIGKPYEWGADGPGSYDCSGLTMAAWLKAGVSLPHNAAAQRREVSSIGRSSLRPGDLVFYYSDIHHVGMYVGGGWIVHASRAGVPVQMRAMDNGDINSYGRPG